MTDEAAKIIIRKHVDDLIRNSGWWIFYKRNFYLKFSKIMEPYEKEANLPFRDELSFPHFIMNKKGLDFGDVLFKRNEIFGVAIKEETIYNSSSETRRYIRDLVFCTEDGKIHEYTLGDTSYLKNLLGHFIELYKLEFYKEN